MSKFAVMLVTLAISQPLFAQTPQSTARFGALRPAQSNPYGKLFEVQSTPKVTRDNATNPATPKRSVVCGLTIIEGDTAIDPKMAKTPSKSEGVTHTIRSIDPQICKP